jgi:hypothetical protein
MHSHNTVTWLVITGHDQQAAPSTTTYPDSSSAAHVSRRVQVYICSSGASPVAPDQLQCNHQQLHKWHKLGQRLETSSSIMLMWSPHWHQIPNHGACEICMAPCNSTNATQCPVSTLVTQRTLLSITRELAYSKHLRNHTAYRTKVHYNQTDVEPHYSKRTLQAKSLPNVC